MAEATEALDLKQFMGGTHHWYRYSGLFRNVLLTDGTKYLAEKAGAYWLMDMIGSHLPKLVKARETWAIATLKRQGEGAHFTLQDDVPANTTFASQKVEFTDFPLPEIKLYVNFDGPDWVICLPEEY